MLYRAINRLKRTLICTIVVLLFFAVVSVIICALQASNEAELRNYEEAYQSVPVTVTVGKNSADDAIYYTISSWVLDLFTGKNTVKIIDVSGAKNLEEKIEIKLEANPIEVSLAEYVKDVQAESLHLIDMINGEIVKNPLLIGITSLSCDKKLLPEYGCEITWKEGYDESIFCDEEPFCIIPEGMVEYYDNGKGEAVLDFSGGGQPTFTVINGELVMEREEHHYQCTLKIVGTYTAGDGKSIYCPFPIVEEVYSKLDKTLLVESLSATIADNRRLDEFREKMSTFFLEPSNAAENIPSGLIVHNRSISYSCEYYYYTLDINDENLFDLAAILEESIKFNRIVTLIVVALSVVAGFLVGFLMIRSRKRDIVLMRTVGESNARVYFGFVLEQMMCTILGIAVGGAYYLWKPIDNLVLFGLVYFVGLTLALCVFLNKNLLKNIKEDE